MYVCECVDVFAAGVAYARNIYILCALCTNKTIHKAYIYPHGFLISTDVF